MGVGAVPARPLSDDDDLLRPTLEEHPRRDPDAPRPFRLGSQVYVAFFGGVLAVTAIALLNARRLGMEGRRRALLLAVGALGFVAAIVVATVTYLEPSTLRLVERGLALATYGVLYLIQRTPDRVYHFFTGNEDDDDDYASLWGPGLLAVIVGGVLQALLFDQLHRDE